MNHTDQTTETNNIFTNAPGQNSYLWKNLVVGKSHSRHWLYQLYQDSPLQDFWLLLTTPLS